MIDEHIQHLNKLLRQYERRLRILEQQAAMFGDIVPPSILMEIEDLTLKISKTHYQIDKLRHDGQGPKLNEKGVRFPIMILSIFNLQEYYLFGICISRCSNKIRWNLIRYDNAPYAELNSRKEAK
jgi:hypothetical protein